MRMSAASLTRLHCIAARACSKLVALNARLLVSVEASFGERTQYVDGYTVIGKTMGTVHALTGLCGGGV